MGNLNVARSELQELCSAMYDRAGTGDGFYAISDLVGGNRNGILTSITAIYTVAGEVEPPIRKIYLPQIDFASAISVREACLDDLEAEMPGFLGHYWRNLVETTKKAKDAYFEQSDAEKGSVHVLGLLAIYEYMGITMIDLADDSSDDGDEPVRFIMPGLAYGAIMIAPKSFFGAFTEAAAAQLDQFDRFAEELESDDALEGGEFEEALKLTYSLEVEHRDGMPSFETWKKQVIEETEASLDAVTDRDKRIELLLLPMLSQLMLPKKRTPSIIQNELFEGRSEK